MRERTEGAATMNRLTLLFSLLLAAALHAQTAQVIQLTSEEAAQAKALYAEKAAVEAKIGQLHDHITTKYVTPVLRTWNDAHPYDLCPWFVGFEYSADFKFIVPAQIKPTGCAPEIMWKPSDMTGCIQKGTCITAVGGVPQ
jgi:hypothetical protein